MTALLLLAVLVAVAKCVECRRLKQRIARFQSRERAYRRMGELMAVSAHAEPNDSPALTLVDGGAS